MPKPKGRNKELFQATHHRLLDVARKMFAEQGYASVNTQEIADKAGVSSGTLFHHFKTKKKLFIQVHNHFQVELIERIERAANDATSAEDRFNRIWQSYLASTDDPAMRQILLLDGPLVIGLQTLRAQDRETAFAFFVTEIISLQNAGVIETISPHALAILLFGALDQAAFEIADFPDDATLKVDLIRQMTHLLDRFKV